jgi:hypothetical protein
MVSSFARLLDENVRLGGIAAAKNSSCVVAEEGDSVALITVQGIKAGMEAS